MNKIFSINDYRSIREHLEAAWDILEDHSHSGYYTDNIENVLTFSEQDIAILNGVSLALKAVKDRMYSIERQLFESVDPYKEEVTNGE